MSYTPETVLASLQSNPDSIRAHWAATKAQFKADLGPYFASQCDSHLALALCSVVAFEYRPYGSSRARSLEALLNEPQLDCDNVVSLAWELYTIIYPRTPSRITAVGWDGGAVGNHAQLQASTPGSTDIMLDPTIGLCVRGINVAPICNGFMVPMTSLKSFWAYSPKPPLTAFEPVVRGAFIGGQFEVEHLLYLIPGLRLWRGQYP
jgi:hypothetical protein